MNKMTRANVDVQPYAFTTKSLFVGHMDYRYVRWQVIDTPGILDHPLEDRNTIEMQSITALAHLNACVLYMLDISEQCGYTIKEQVGLFHSIKPLFSNKSLIVIVNKIDVIRPEKLASDDWELIQSLTTSATGGIGGVQVVPMSTFTEEGVSNVKQIACDTLLKDRVEKKLNSAKGPKDLNRLHLALPVPRDSKVRAPYIPESVSKGKGKEKMEEDIDPKMLRILKLMEKEEEEASLYSQGLIPGLGNMDWKEAYTLKDDEWRYDKIPEIMDGHNIADWIDSDIAQMLDELEREEEEREALAEAKGEYVEKFASDEELDEDDKILIDEIKEKRGVSRLLHSMRPRHATAVSRQKLATKTPSDLEGSLFDRGIDSESAGRSAESLGERKQSFSRSRSRSREAASHIAGRKRVRSESRGLSSSSVTVSVSTSKQRSQSRGLSRSLSRSTLGRTPSPKPGAGFHDLLEKIRAIKKGRRAQRANNKMARKGEGDRVILNMKPKHLFSGKGGIGKRDWR